jgi:hypothetical protein
LPAEDLLDADELAQIKATLAQTELYTRPFKVEEIVRYLIKQAELDYGDDGLTGWEQYFSQDPSEDYINASLTEDGAKRILKLIGIIAD